MLLCDGLKLGQSHALGAIVQNPGKGGGRRGMLVAPIWSGDTIAGSLTFDFFREPPGELKERDIIKIIHQDKKNLETLMRNASRYAEKIEALLF